MKADLGKRRISSHSVILQPCSVARGCRCGKQQVSQVDAVQAFVHTVWLLFHKVVFHLLFFISSVLAAGVRRAPVFSDASDRRVYTPRLRSLKNPCYQGYYFRPAEALSGRCVWSSVRASVRSSSLAPLFPSASHFMNINERIRPSAALDPGLFAALFITTLR